MDPNQMQKCIGCRGSGLKARGVECPRCNGSGFDQSLSWHAAEIAAYMENERRKESVRRMAETNAETEARIRADKKRRAREHADAVAADRKSLRVFVTNKLPTIGEWFLENREIALSPVWIDMLTPQGWTQGRVAHAFPGKSPE